MNWKNYKDTLYQVSDTGLVRRNGKILKSQYDKRGYKRISLSINGKKINKRIHQLVAETFIPNPNNKRTVNHDDGDKTNNNVSNLIWNTHKENNHHAIENGLIDKKRQLEDYQVQEIRQKYIPYKYSCQKLADEYGVSWATIKDIVNNTTYHQTRPTPRS